MQIVLIDKEERDRLLDVDYEPPAEISDEELKNQWLQVHDAVRRRLETRWAEGVGPSTEFYMDLDWDRSRLLAIEVSNEKMLEPWLVESIQDVLCGFEERYAVDVCDSWVFLKDSDGKSYPHFTVIIEKEKVHAYSEARRALEKLGLVV